MSTRKIRRCIVKLPSDEVCGVVAVAGSRCELHDAQYKTLKKHWEQASATIDECPAPQLLEFAEQIRRSEGASLKLVKVLAVIVPLLEALHVERTARDVAQDRFEAPLGPVDASKIRFLVQLNRKVDEFLDEDDVTQPLIFLALVENQAGSPNNDMLRKLTDFGEVLPEAADSTGRRAPGPDVIWLYRTLEGALLRAHLDDPPQSRLLDMLNDDKERDGDDPVQQAALFAKRSFAHRYAVLLDERPIQRVKRGFEIDYNAVQCIRRSALGQLFRRILLYSPHTRAKVLRMKTFDDLFLSLEITPNDLETCEHTIRNLLGNGLVWWKCAVKEALQIASGETPQEPTLDVLGSWIYVSPGYPTLTLRADGWMLLTAIVGQPPQLESKFTPLCATFDEMHTFLSFVHLCLPPPDHVVDLAMAQTRAVLCQAGFLMAELVPSERNELLPSSFPTEKPGKRRGTVEWFQMQRRSYVNGIIAPKENEWTTAFINALAASCVVVVYDETMPSGDSNNLHVFGGPPNEIADWWWRTRTFDGPKVSPEDMKSHLTPGGIFHDPQIVNPGPWETFAKASEILVFDPLTARKQTSSSRLRKMFELEDRPLQELLGWVTRMQRGKQTFLFSNKAFPTRYICILDSAPRTDGLDLLRRVKIAALKAAGLLSKSNPSDGDIAVAAADLHERRVQECF